MEEIEKVNIYDRLPLNKKWRDWREQYAGDFHIYKYDESFYCIFLFFGESKSKNYAKALRIYSSIPDEFRVELLAHSVQIFKYSDFLRIRTKFIRLYKMVRGWKTSQLWINNELCELSDFTAFIDVFDCRVQRYNARNWRTPLPRIEEE